MFSQENNQEVKLEESSIFWERLAEPQNDQYDSLIILELAKKAGYVRQDVGNDPTFFDGKVAIRSDNVKFPLSCIPASPDQPNITNACQLIRLWPTVFHQCQLLLESVSPFIDTQVLPNGTNSSICSSGTKGFGTIASTVNSAIGFAEAIVYELGHHKLRTLGVQFESAKRLIKNPPEQKFSLPIRYDCLLSMSSVLHYQYSYTYISALDVEIIKAGIDLARDRYIAKQSLAVILPKLEFGLEIIEHNAETDSAGSQFLEGYFVWLMRLLEEGYRILDDFKIAPIYLDQPLAVQINAIQPQRKPISSEPIYHNLNDLSLSHFDNDNSYSQTNSMDIAYQRPRRINDIEEHHLIDEMVLYNPEKEIAFSFNNSARAVWDLCDGKHTIIDIGKEISQRLGISGDELLVEGLLSDIRDIVAQLHNFGLLELS